MANPKAPLYRDPIYDGAADPTVIWNRDEKSWWLVYTQRRASVECQNVAYCHGSDIGIASSTDGGQNWTYRGVMEGLKFERGHNSFWAPEILFADGLYHMYCSYVPGIPSDWIGPRNLVHYTSRNLWDWEQQSVLSLSSDRVIDACVHKMPSGKWRLWYKDEDNQSHTYAADSEDLYSWETLGPVITDCPHEGPNVFVWQGSYWMITDPWCGLGVYKSDDAESWVRQANILTRPGRRVDDGSIGGHADVLVQGDRAYVFYFVHPHRDAGLPGLAANNIPYAERRTSIQVAELKMVDGQIQADRDADFEFKLLPGS